jgi:hypothetical protein
MAARMTVYNDGRTPILKGGFKPFSTSVPTTSQEWEQRRVQLRKTLWRLLGDVPALFTPAAAIRKKQAKHGYMLERFTFDNGVGDAVYGYILIPAHHRGRGPAILYSHYHGGKYKQGKKEVLTKAFSELDFATGEELARKGYIVQCIDAYAFGERCFQGPAGSNEEGENTESSLFKTFLWEGRTLWGMMVRDAFQRHLYNCYAKESNFRGVLYPGVGHTYTRQMWKETLRWLKKHL